MLKVYFLSLFLMAQAGETAQKPTPSPLDQAEQKYMLAKTVKSKVTKKLKLKLLNQERTVKGTLELKKVGKFRIEFTEGEKTLALTDSKTIWSITFPTDPDFDNTVRVLRSKDARKAQSQVLVAFLLGQGSLKKHYDVVSESKSEASTSYQLKSKDKDSEIKEVKLVVNKKSEIVQVEYTDALENITTLLLSEIQFNKPIAESKFIYKIPKGAEVTEL